MMPMIVITMTNKQHTGVCKINGVVIVVNCCYSIGFSTTTNNNNTVFFANTGSSNNGNSDNNGDKNDNNV